LLFIVVALASAFMIGLLAGLIGVVFGGLKAKSINQTTYPGQRIVFSIKNSFLGFLRISITCVVFFLALDMLMFIFRTNINGIWLIDQVVMFIDGANNRGILDRFQTGMVNGLVSGSFIGLIGWFVFGGFAVSQHYTLRFVVAIKKILPWHLVPFLDHCTDLIFLRRVGGGYIFVHRLLMEHFAAMYSEPE
jgi:hypothetical protein